MLESALLVASNAGVHKRQNAGKKLMHALLLVEVVDHGRILARQRLKAFLASGIRQAAPIENEAATVAGIILRILAMKRKTENSNGQIFRLRCKTEQLFRSQHAVKSIEQCRQCNGQGHIVQKPAQVFQRIRNTLQKVCFTLVKSAKPISTKRLHNAHINVSVVVAQKSFAIEVNVVRKPVEIMIQQLLAEFRRQVCLGIEQERGNVILQRTLASALVVHKIGLPIAQHDVSGLKVTIQKVVARSLEQKIAQQTKIFLESAFAKRNTGKPQKIIFEIVQVPGNGLLVEAANGIASAVI